VFLLQAMEHLQSFIADCDRKTEVAKRRLKETQEELSEEANTKVITPQAGLQLCSHVENTIVLRHI